MKSLWVDQYRDEIVNRLDDLSPDAERRWGTLNSHAAIVHLADSLRMALGQVTEAPIRSALRYHPMKWLAINVLPMPKGVKGPAGYFTSAPTSFDDDRRALKQLIDQCAATPADGHWGENPFFGRLTRAQWGILAYKHIDHHLRQFGG